MACKSCEQAKNLLNRSNNIVQGYSNLLFKNEEVEKTAKARYEVCLKCPKKAPLIVINGVQHYLCTLCKCPLDAKVRALNENCPKGDW